ncbi:MAG: phosphoglucomutase, alpha-D-glucose phosphate-specific [Polyangiaceae bacterium]|jgi:phosphoglucomutase
MTLDPHAGQVAPIENLVNLAALEHAYYADHPDPDDASERVTFGTSGHRGSSLRRSFNDDHIAAIASAICDYRQQSGIAGPLFLGMDTHALSVPALITATEILAARGVHLMVAPEGSYTPTPAVSRAILVHNRTAAAQSDGIVVTPSHNPPEDGGFKYDPPHGGPAESTVTAWIERRANELLRARGVQSLPRISVENARQRGLIETYDFLTRYVNDLQLAIDFAAIAQRKARIGVNPMGGASIEYWSRIGDQYDIELSVVNSAVDKTFSFIPRDHDGKIRTDCSSPYAMATLLRERNQFDIAVANDADADRHGIVTPASGLLPPNHYLSVAVDYLFRHRSRWSKQLRVGKTAVTSNMVNRVARALGRELYEVPVGFKWFVAGLHSATLGFGGEESAGASFLARDGSTWTTDKDGMLLALLAAEILSVTGHDPGERYKALERSLGNSFYTRRDGAAPVHVRERLLRASPEDWSGETLAGDAVVSRQTHADSGGDLGGLKVATDHGWFAIRPSGTEDIYKLYAESFRSEDHLERIVAEATERVTAIIAGV